MEKKLMSFRQMFNLNFGFLGIQFGWALQMANMSGIYKFLGATEADMAHLWIFAPLTGLLIQPIFGQISDRTWTRLGRRKPFILAGAILSTFALILMPNSFSVLMAASLLFLLDGSLNIAMQPYRALVGDVAPKSQQTVCYAIQTCLVGVGATLASVLPWVFLHVFHMQSAIGPNTVPITLKLSFYVGAAFFILANLWTIFTSKEYPPEKSLETIKEKSSALKELKNIFIAIVKMPVAMRELSLVQIFTWIGLFCFFLYFGLGVAQNIFGLPPGANVAGNADYHKMLEQGIALGGLLCGLYTFLSVFFSALIPTMSRIITRKGTHILFLCLGAAGLISANYVHSASYLFIAMVGLGAAWASIVTIPYAILASAVPENKMGVYMGIFNMAICIPEIIASLTLGLVIFYFFHNHAMSIVLLGGVSMLIAAFFMLLVHDEVKH